MAQTILLRSPSISSCTPSSPDPTPLRMLAFSVAEAALQQDPNSPMFASDDSMPGQDPWGYETKGRFSRWAAEPKVTQSIASRRGKPLWEMVDKARERREKEKSSPSTIDSPLPTSPISPNSYTFVLPSNSHLAASVAAPSKYGLKMPTSPTKQYPFPLYTRSAEPSPTKSTFCALDQTRPPPEFVPRLSAKEFADAPPAATSPSQRLQAQATTRLNFPTRKAPNGNSKLPSLAEIQQKMRAGTRNAHRRNESAGSMPRVTRSDSESSCELITTPDEEINRFNLVIVSGNDRSPSPPVESRLAPFLRQRTSGRLVHAPRPLSMPPASYDQVFCGGGDKPSFTITPPSATPSVPPPSARAAPTSITPVRPVFAAFATPPMSKSRADSPCSPTDSARSPSPTLSIPIITCTPAQQGDSDSDSESEPDVVVFDGMIEEAKEKEERERRGRAMKDMLLSRRRSLQ